MTIRVFSEGKLTYPTKLRHRLDTCLCHLEAMHFDKESSHDDPIMVGKGKGMYRICAWGVCNVQIVSSNFQWAVGIGDSLINVWL